MTISPMLTEYSSGCTSRRHNHYSSNLISQMSFILLWCLESIPKPPRISIRTGNTSMMSISNLLRGLSEHTFIVVVYGCGGDGGGVLHRSLASSVAITSSYCVLSQWWRITAAGIASIVVEETRTPFPFKRPWSPSPLDRSSSSHSQAQDDGNL
jgi:hypothetical protein